MITSTCKALLRIDGAFSLKDKRRIIKSIIGRTKSRYNVCIAQIDKDDLWNSAVIGIACVSNDVGYTEGLLHTVIDFLESDPRIEVLDCTIETIHID